MSLLAAHGPFAVSKVDSVAYHRTLVLMQASSGPRSEAIQGG
jgi:hypothetical protein